MAVSGSRDEKRRRTIYRNALDYLDDVMLGARGSDATTNERIHIACFLADHLALSHELEPVEEDAPVALGIIYKREGEQT